MQIGYVSNERVAHDLGQFGGSGHYRLSIPGRALAERGHEVRFGVLVGDGRPGVASSGLLGVLDVADWNAPRVEQCERAWYPPVIVLHRYMLRGLADGIRRARAAGQVVINDVDDLFDVLPPSNRAWAATHPQRDPNDNRAHYRDVLAASSLVTCSTPFLAHKLTYARTAVVRNAIDFDRWTTHRPHRPPRLGWTGSLQYRANDIELLSGVVRPLLGVEFAPTFHHTGAIPELSIGDRLGIDASQVVDHPQLPINEWPNAYADIDVGVVPLQQHSFNYAKSYIKGVEMSASGIPFVASPSPEYLWLQRECGVGLLARRPREWIGSLRRLARDELNADEYRNAVKSLSIDQRWQEWLDVYEHATP